MVSFGLPSLSLKSFATKMLFLTKLARMFLTSSSALLPCLLCPELSSGVEVVAFCQKLRTLLALSDLTIPNCGLAGGDLLRDVCSCASFSLIWKVEGEFRRDEPGEMSLRVVSSIMVESALLREFDFAIRRGDTPDCFVSRGFVVVPERRRELRLGGRFSVSVMSLNLEGLDDGELTERRLLDVFLEFKLFDGLMDCSFWRRLNEWQSVCLVGRKYKGGFIVCVSKSKQIILATANHTRASTHTRQHAYPMHPNGTPTTKNSVKQPLRE